MSTLLSDFKPGPLDVYRKKASFDWKKLKIFLETEEIVQHQQDVYEALQNSPEFSTPNTIQSLDTERYNTFKRAEAIQHIKELSLEYEIQNLRRPAANTRILFQSSPAASVKCGVGYALFTNSIMNMGTDRHTHFITDCLDGKIKGCYCLTEIGHSSNARGMRTTATYDKNRKVFVLHSPDFEAAKCWTGGLGQAATHAVLYAQLILDGKKYGLHAFVVPIRNPNTLLPFAGLTVGDMGEKMGLNGVDNGFVQFDNYDIPRENLLNKVADVTEDGRYVTPIKDPNKRHGAALGFLSAGRVNITVMCEALAIKALSIAIRYAAVRRQSGPTDDEELPILEYQSHQHRLLPHLAASYVFRIFNNYFGQQFYQFSIEKALGMPKENAPEMGMEIHALSSACKPVAGWATRDAIQECRESCAGHGYLKYAGIGDIKNDHDANLTYEGENHVLIQQTSNYLLKLWPLILKGQKISSPLESVDFLSNSLDILARSKFNARNVEEICLPTNIINVYQWLVCYLLKQTYEKYERETQQGKSAFWAKNDMQVFYAKSLAIVYVQHYFLHRMLATISEANEASIKNVLTRLFALYGLYTLEKHVAYVYQGQYATGPQLAALIHESILKLCLELKNDAVALIDAVAPPDFVLNSVLGASDGMVYKHIEQKILRSPYSMNRPTWWQEIINLEGPKNKL